MSEGRLQRRCRQGLLASKRNRRGCPTVALNNPQEGPLETYDPHKSTTEVRQASPRKMNLRVLVTSLIGVVVLFAVIYLIYTLTQSNPS